MLDGSGASATLHHAGVAEHVRSTVERPFDGGAQRAVVHAELGGQPRRRGARLPTSTVASSSLAHPATAAAK